MGRPPCLGQPTGLEPTAFPAEEGQISLGYHQTNAYQKAMNKRKVWVEPLFAEAKDWHGMCRFRLRLLWRVNCEALRIATGQNLKRLLKKRGWGRRPLPTEALCASFWLIFWGIDSFFWEKGLFLLANRSAYSMSRRDPSLFADELYEDFFNRLLRFLRQSVMPQNRSVSLSFSNLDSYPSISWRPRE